MSPTNKYLIVIAGPTASGKTVAAVNLAKHFQTEVLSADSRQFYREMQIGTAKPTPAEMEGIPHHFIDSLSIFDEYSVGDFEQDALNILEQIYQNHQVAILTGGSGLFIRAVCEGLDRFPEVPAKVRKKVEALYLEKGLEFVQDYLQRVDPVYFQEVDQNNPHRLIRALAVYEASGMPFSHFRKGTKAKRSFIPVYFLLEWDRKTLYQRIDKRVDQMIAQGLEAEARELYPHRTCNPLQTVGYQELFDYFEGKTTLEEAISLIKQHTRNYAKRQLTWFRKHGEWIPFEAEDMEGMKRRFLEMAFLEEKNTT
ncbi:MAG: tRNA (adenosine(37)-N6)-dimethylallyltransferase MiaA [Saprospirales bacterium]|nr:tRNA (adenosine(37)-N6)-dimethylallyltransferase MiaA [Saprospirales bacterium]